jgi:anti-sigma factor RsiW
MKEISCEQLLHYLSDYIDDNLDEELTAVAQHHLATCANCHVVLDTTQLTITLFRQQGKRIIPAQRRQHLFDRLQEAFLSRKTAESQ